MCTDAPPVFSAQSGRRVRGRSAVQHCAPRVFRDKPKGWYAAEVLWKQSVVSSSPGPAAGGRRRGKLEYYLAARRPGLEVRGVDAFEPVANLHRCYLRRDPVFLRSLLRLVGRRVDRRFYSGRLLPGALRRRAGRRAACAYVLLRNSFSGKWGSFAQQRS